MGGQAVSKAQNGGKRTEVLTVRLIDVDDLGVGRCSKDVLPAAYCAGWNGLLGLIEKAPTVDAVVVTRCKDCKHLCVWNRKDIYAFCLQSLHRVTTTASTVGRTYLIM